MAFPAFLRPRVLVAATAALALSACFGAPDVMKQGGGKRAGANAPQRPQVTGTPSFTCPLAKNFAAWARYAVKPAGRQFFGQDVVKIETYGTYSCRNIYGGRSGRISQHAYSNAIDIAGFVLADGRRIMLDGGWNGDQASRDFLRALHKSACRRFGTVLSPDYNAAHYNHFHMDMSGNGYCR